MTGLLPQKTAGGLYVSHEFAIERTEDFPLLAERVAIDLTGALRNADAGLRGLRRRPMLRRIWESATGKGQERHSAIGADLVAAQKSVLTLVQHVMKEESRSQYCINRVLLNLHALNGDVTHVVERLTELEEIVTVRQAFHTAWMEQIGQVADQLVHDLEATRQRLDRLSAVRHLTERYRAGRISAAAGEVLGAAQFLATIGWQYADEGHANAARELETALYVIEQRIDSNRPRPLAEAILEAAADVQSTMLEPMLYISHESSGVLRAVAMLIERRAAGLRVDLTSAADAVAVTRTLADPDGQLSAGLVRKVELVQAIAQELLPPGADS